MHDLLPLISCICITRKKPLLLQRSIQCFIAQTYPCKQLVIVYEDDDPETEGFLDQAAFTVNIRVVKVKRDSRTPLGELRNMGINHAGGEFVCQWDDDDWYHMDRLSVQYEALAAAGRDGSILTRWLVFNSISGKAYLSNRRLWEGSILCRKTTLQTKAYVREAKGEDTATIDYLFNNDHLQLLENSPALYAYVYHGKNTWDADHWDFIFQCSTEFSQSDSAEIAAILNRNHSVARGSLLLDQLLERRIRAMAF